MAEQELQPREKVKKPEPIQYGLIMDTHTNLGKEIDEFENESKARRIIAELVRPIMESADLDRRNNVMLDMKMKKMHDRLHMLEHMFGVAEVKPKIF